MARSLLLPVVPVALVVLVVGIVASACSQPAADANPEPPSALVTFRTDRADSRGASLASAGSGVAVVWAATTDGQTNIYAAVSEDAGVTFGQPVRVNDVDGDARVNGEQPPRVGMDAGKNIVVAWESRREGLAQVRVARSVDAGKTFQPAQSYHDPGLTGARGWASLVMDGSGNTHAAWLDGRNAAPRKVSASKPMSGAAHAHAEPTRQDIFHAVMRADGSRSESLVATNVCFCCKTSVAVGGDGVTYVAWRHIYPTNFRDMAVARSTDGVKFDAPVRVSEDGWQIAGCPEDGPSIVVSAGGVLHIAWPTIADAEASRKGIFYSYSTDGARTFAPRVRIDDGADTTNAAHPQIAVVGESVAVTWDERANDKARIRTRLISSRAGEWQPELAPPVTVSSDAQVTYPAVVASGTVMVVSWTENTTNGGEIHIQRIPLKR